MGVPFDQKLISLIRRVLSVAETGRAEWDPSVIYIYADDNRFTPARKQITLSIGFTESGNLKKVLQRYISKGGALSAAFATYLPSLGAGQSRAGDVKFINLLKSAGIEHAMKAAQTECFEELYLEPAFTWAISNGFRLPLSYLVIADSYLHSGSMLAFLMNRFQEKRPVNADNEQRWIRSYLDTRKNWLSTHSNKILHKTVYRANCYLTELTKGNWMLADTPIVMNGVSVMPV